MPSPVKSSAFYKDYFKEATWSGFYWDVGSYCTRKAVRDLIQHKTGRLLEIGVGVGCALYDFAAFERFGVDYADKTAYVAKTNLDQRGHAVSMLQGDGQQLPVRDKSFDVIVSAHTLEHIADDLQVLYECERLLCPGGELVLLVPGRLSGLATKEEWERWGHYRTYNEQRFRNLAASCERLTLQEIYFVHKSHNLVWNRIKHMFSYLNYPLKRILFRDGKTFYERSIYQQSLLPILVRLLDSWDARVRDNERYLGDMDYNVLARFVKR